MEPHGVSTLFRLAMLVGVIVAAVLGTAAAVTARALEDLQAPDTVTYADGNLYIQSENKTIGLVEATTSGYRERGRFEIPDKGQMSWAHPAISDGRLYVRNQDALLVYDIKGSEH